MTSKELFVSYSTIVRKEFLRFIKIWPQTILPAAINTSLYFLVFGHFLGERIGEINNYSYTSFIAPGLIMMAIIMNSYANSSSSFFMAKFQKHIEELIVSPTPNWVKLIGFVSGGVLRGVITGFVVLLASLFFTDISVHSFLAIIGFFLLSSTVFSLLGFINGVFAKSFDGIMIVPTFVITPLLYLGGVFYSIQSLSEFWQNVSQFNPLLYIINGFRYGFLGFSDINVWVSFLVLLFTVVVLWLISLRLLKKTEEFKI